MKASQEYRQWVKNLRSRYGRKNGVISSCFFDHPDLFRHLGTDKKSQKPPSIDPDQK
jgi:hypothetical protein